MTFSIVALFDSPVPLEFASQQQYLVHLLLQWLTVNTKQPCLSTLSISGNMSAQYNCSLGEGPLYSTYVLIYQTHSKGRKTLNFEGYTFFNILMCRFPAFANTEFKNQAELYTLKNLYTFFLCLYCCWQ